MRVLFTPEAWDDYRHWATADPGFLGRLNELIESIRRTPFAGIGKPEPLRNELTGWWSRRINVEHRIVYRVEGKGEAQTVIIAYCRFHYDRH